MASGGTTWQARNAASRANRAVRINCRMVSYVDKVFENTKLSVFARLRIAAQMTRDATVYNISRPVTKRTSRSTVMTHGLGWSKKRTVSKTRVDPKSRSKPGEFPKADTTRLMKDIFYDIDRKQLVARVGTTLDYAIFLETRLNRSFLRRTLTQMLPFIRLLFRESASQQEISGALNSAQVEPNPSPQL